MIAKLKKGDVVIVISGDDKGKTGNIISVDKRNGKAIVIGINIVKKHMKLFGDKPGGIIEKEAPIELSNLMLFDESLKKGVRTGVKLIESKSGPKRTRFIKKTGRVLE